MTPQSENSSQLRSFVSFWLGDALFGIDILEIREINSEQRITPIFHAPPQVRGYVNIRGQIHLVLAPHIPLGLPAAEEGRSRRRLLVFKPSVAEGYALQIDRIGDIVQARQDSIEDPEPPVAGSPALSVGMCKLDGRLMEILDPRGFLALSA